MSKPYIRYYDMAPGICAFSTTRHGGASKGNYASFNVHPFQHDDPQALESNRKSLLSELGIQANHLLMPRQVHGNQLAIIDESYFERTAEEQVRLIDGVDALVTNLDQTCVGVSTADCVPVLLYDARRGVIAAVHAGWRGTCMRIVETVLQTMSHTFSTKPADVKAVIGPCIRQDAYEVGEEVYEAFSDAHFDMNRVAVKKKDKWHIDLAAANLWQMQLSGVPSGSVYDCGLCTYLHNADYFSARRQGIESGRIYTGIMLTNGARQ